VASAAPTLDAPSRPAARAPAARRARLVISRWGLRGTALLYLGLLVIVPLIAVLTKGFGHGTGDLRAALDHPGAMAAIKLTLIASGFAALINGVFGTLLAYVLVRFRFPGRGVLGALVDLPFAIPTLVTGVMLVALYGPNSPIGAFLKRNGINVIFAPLGILLALMFITLPLVVRAVEPVLLELDPAEEEAARVLGANGWVTFRRIVLPAIRPAITAGILLSFARALGEFGSIVIVSGNITGKTLTAPVFIFQLISQFKPEQAAAVSAVLFGLSFILVMVTERLIHRRPEPKESR
jgi:sulfate transport system permease protein